MAAALVDTATPVGAGALLALLFGYLFKELRRKDDSVWQIIADRDKIHAAALAEKDAERARAVEEKDKQIAQITRDRDFWRRRTLDAEDEAHQGIIDRQDQRDRGEDITG